MDKPYIFSLIGISSLLVINFSVIISSKTNSHEKLKNKEEIINSKPKIKKEQVKDNFLIDDNINIKEYYFPIYTS